MYKTLLLKKLEQMHQNYDHEKRMPVEIKADGGAGYHTKLSGAVHPIVLAANYAAAIYCARQEAYYPRAEETLKQLVSLQDARPGSDTFGLWAYYAEQGLDEMLAPDYNWADFIGKQLAYILKKRDDCLSGGLKQSLRTALRNAAACSLKRNVSPDYTNISIMSKITIICAGELLGDAELLEEGKRRLKKVAEYDAYCGCFSEYNSSAYTPLAIEEAARMQLLFDDPECREMTRLLNHMGWECLAMHYHTRLGQLAPPQMRAYRDLDNGSLGSFIYLGTEGRYGRLEEESVNAAWLQLPLHCPEDLRHWFDEQGERRINQTFYKKNTIRSRGEDATIIRNLDSPDLKAFSYLSDSYAAGAFEKSDLWNQRRTSMVVWGVEHPCYLRLRCLNDQYDYCSGLVYTAQSGNVMLSNLGFATDRGDFHYILDKVKDGVLRTRRLCFRFEVGGDCQNVVITRDNRRFTVTDVGIEIQIEILAAVFDGAPMDVVWNETEKWIDLVCFDEERTVDFHQLGESYASFCMSVNGSAAGAEAVCSGGAVTAICRADGHLMKVVSPALPTGFDAAIESSVTEVS